MSRRRQDAVGLSASELRFLAFLITKAFSSLSYEHRLSVGRNSVGHIVGTRFPADSSPVITLNFDCPTWPEFEVVDLNDQARRVDFSRSRHIPDVRDVWRQDWSFQADGPAEDASLQFPVLAFVPRTWEAPQLMAIVLTLRDTVSDRQGSGVEGSDVEHRWIYYN
ncbi:hypothetical protein FIBSPDRAFT_1044258 [Athelia psychrophila]|uniref:Uncharacterized protein n=1 Tax=Athelia psychrophila TaxID=1759441 RepID=A0A166JXB7_9AGAM|nr:hypothetical protein FIBSPDRAFT_1044258 [Fibularhizoctonia sp. CBS 109695]